MSKIWSVDDLRASGMEQIASELLLPTLIIFRDPTTVSNITFQYFQCSLLHPLKFLSL